ncbi:hypothetical protein NLM27_26180 [Bradyrhizobium sp. CCGB12]|uniref:hypothetical protein n=1 Tax=Bradyrhizobium sp. CCGB12 TaxID=2949632 RepID=UPI0020B33C05|nr:hypothetical protein [Bradyrhizobium sp. CCGB12]MCP3392252.1 hypothetical protein [Bradyrhizobium sp. CCGB12]
MIETEALAVNRRSSFVVTECGNAVLMPAVNVARNYVRGQRRDRALSVGPTIDCFAAACERFFRGASWDLLQFGALIPTFAVHQGFQDAYREL